MQGMASRLVNAAGQMVIVKSRCRCSACVCWCTLVNNLLAPPMLQIRINKHTRAMFCTFSCSFAMCDAAALYCVVVVVLPTRLQIRQPRFDPSWVIFIHQPQRALITAFYPLATAQFVASCSQLSFTI